VPDDVGYAKIDAGEPHTPTISHGVDPKHLKRTHELSGKTSTREVERIAHNMRGSGYDSQYPIDVAEHNGEFYILDGHHRAAAARQSSTKVSIRLITNIRDHRGSLDSIEEVIESATNVGNDRLEHRRRR
jgi:hypothetical protein